MGKQTLGPTPQAGTQGNIWTPAPGRNSKMIFALRRICSLWLDDIGDAPMKTKDRVAVGSRRPLQSARYDHSFMLPCPLVALLAIFALAMIADLKR